MSFKRSLGSKLFLLGLCLIIIGLVILLKKEPKIVNAPGISPTSIISSYAKVVRVYDGDTIEIEGGQKVRYIGVDSPEVYPSRQCFSDEARIENEKLVKGREVKLVKDVSETDKYGRLLRYVYVDSPSTGSGQISLFVNDFLVKSGFAKVMTVPPDIRFQQIFSESEKYARGNNLGFWGKCF